MRINHGCWWFCCKIQMSIAIENLYYRIIAHLFTISSAMFLLQCRNGSSSIKIHRDLQTNRQSLRIHHHLLYRTNQRETRDCNLVNATDTGISHIRFEVPNHCQLSQFRNQVVAKVTQDSLGLKSHLSRVYCDATNNDAKNRGHQMSQHSVPTFFWDVAFLKRCSISYNTQRDFSNKINSKTLQSMFFLLYSILYIIVKNFFIYFVYLQYCWYNFIEIVWYMMMIVANAT